MLQSSGAFAWISSAATLEVHGDDAAGDALMHSGAHIDPASLAAGGAQLYYWTRGGTPHSAPFR